MSKDVEYSGTVEDVFAHRFTLATEAGKKLIDLAPGGEKAVKIKAGQQVAIKGEDKPGEVKAKEVRIGDGEWQPAKASDDAVKPPAKADDDHAPAPPHGKHDSADGERPSPKPEPELDDEHVTRMLDEAGYTDHDERERKPKHVEVMATKDGQRHKVHVHKDGVKKAEPVT